MSCYYWCNPCHQWYYFIVWNHHHYNHHHGDHHHHSFIIIIVIIIIMISIQLLNSNRYGLTHFQLVNDRKGISWVTVFLWDVIWKWITHSLWTRSEVARHENDMSSLLLKYTLSNFMRAFTHATLWENHSLDNKDSRMIYATVQSWEMAVDVAVGI